MHCAMDEIFLVNLIIVLRSLKLTAFVSIVPYHAYVNVWINFDKAYVRNAHILIKLKSESYCKYLTINILYYRIFA